MKTNAFLLASLLLLVPLVAARHSLAEPVDGGPAEVAGQHFPKMIGEAGTEGYEWRAVPDAPEQSALMKHGVQVGNYFHNTGFYYRSGRKHLGPAIAPVVPPFKRKAAGEDPAFFGVKREMLCDCESYSYGSTEITRPEVESLLLGDALTDDSAAGHVSVIAKDAAIAKRAADDWQTLTATYPRAKGVRFQSYDYGQPVTRLMLACNRLDVDAEFQRTGVVVLAQAAGDDKDGRSKPTRAYQYDGVPTLTDALRTVDPLYNPNGPKLPTLPTFGGIVELLAAVGAGLVLLVLLVVAFIFK